MLAKGSIYLLHTDPIIIMLSIISYKLSLYADERVQSQLLKPQTPIFQRLADIATSGDDGGVEAVGKAFELYRSCMDAATIESLGATPLLNLIRDTLGTV